MRDFYSVVIPINTKGEVLLGKRLEDGIWTTPAGGSEGSETPVECVIREAYEEAQLDILPNQLEYLYEKEAQDGKSVWCYLFRSGQQHTSPENDPDNEVSEWLWIDPENFPKEIHSPKNKIRKDTIMDALAVFHNHVFAKSSKKRVWGTSKTEILAFVQALRTHQPVLAEKLYQKLYPNADQAHDTELGDLQKSSIHQEYQDGAMISTGEVAQELISANRSWLKRFQDAMDGFNYGDAPVEFEMPKGVLLLTKVGDGMYSGYFQYRNQVLNESTNYLEEMADNAKVRIERLALPALCLFLQAKGWIDSPTPDVVETSTSNPTELLDKKIQILTLLSKLTNP